VELYFRLTLKNVLQFDIPGAAAFMHSRCMTLTAQELLKDAWLM
jgi:hypothetical protein